MLRPLFPNGGRPLANDDLDRLLTYTDKVARGFYGMLAQAGVYDPDGIVYGCEVTYNSATGIMTIMPGMVSLQGEWLTYPGGNLAGTTAYLYKSTWAGPAEDDYRTFADGNDYACAEYRECLANASSPVVVPYITLTATGQRPTLLRAISNAIMPTGAVIMFSGNPATILSGWALCNGQTINGYTTPDLRGRFVVGYDPADADYNAIGDKNTAAKTRTLTEANLPPHQHNVAAMSAGIPARTGGTGTGSSADTTGGGNGTALAASVPAHTTDSGAGISQPFDIRPPYYTLAYIVKLP